MKQGNGGAMVPHVETLRSMCQRLAMEAKRPIEASAELGGLPIFVNRRSLSGEDVLAAAAIGFRASVVNKNGVLLLTRTDQDRKNFALETRHFWQKRLSEWLEKSDRMIRKSAGLGGPAEQYRYYAKIQSDQLKGLQKSKTPVSIPVSPDLVSPSGVMHVRLMQQIGIDRLTDIGPDERKIWSNQPETHQFQCPNGEALLQAYAASQRLFRRKTRPAGEAQSDLDGEPTRFTFKQIGGLTFDLSIYDRKGHRTDGMSVPLSFQMAGDLLLSSRLYSRQFTHDAEWLPLDKGSIDSRKDLVYGLSPWLPPEGPACLSVTHPEQSDPLDHAARIGLTGMADHAGQRGFVAVPTDRMLWDADGCIQENRLNLTAFERYLDWEYERVEVGNTIVLRPRNPYRWSHRDTVDRELLATQLREMERKSRIDTAAMAEAYLHLFPHGQSSLAEQILNRFIQDRPHLRINTGSLSSRAGAWLGAALSAVGDQRSASFDGNAEPFRSLIHNGINENWMRFTSSVPRSDAELDPAVAFDRFPTTHRIEVHIRRANVVACKVTEQPDANPETANYLPLSDWGAGVAQTMVVRIGFDYRQHPELLPTPEQVQSRFETFGLFHTGISTEYTVDFYATPELRNRLVVQEDEPVAVNLPFAKLPPKFRRTLLDSAMEWLRLFGQGKVHDGEVHDAGEQPKPVPPP